MKHGPIEADAFNAGWEERAVAYDGYFGSLTGQAVEPLLDAASVGTGTRVLDVATGPGWDGLTGATVRMSWLVMAQPEDTRQRIREAFDRRLEDYRTADGFELPVSVKLGSGRKPASTG